MSIFTDPPPKDRPPYHLRNWSQDDPRDALEHLRRLQEAEIILRRPPDPPLPRGRVNSWHTDDVKVT